MALLSYTTALETRSASFHQGTSHGSARSLSFWQDPGAPEPDGDSIMGESDDAGSQGTDESARTSVQRQSNPGLCK